VKGKGLEGSALGVQLILEIQLAASSIDVDGVELDIQAPVAHNELVAKVEEEHNGRSKVVLEEGFGVGRCSDGPERNVEGGDQAENVKTEADITAPDAELGCEGKFISAAAVDVNPCIAEANMCQADGAPGEEA